MVVRPLLWCLLASALLWPVPVFSGESRAQVRPDEDSLEESNASGLRQGQSLPGQGGRIYKLLAGSELRTSAVWDDDLRNDLSLEWYAGATLQAAPGLSSFALLSFSQSFNPEQNESSVQLGDLQLGATYFQGFVLNLGPLRKLFTKQSFGVFLPSSRISRAQDLRFGLFFNAKQSVELLKNLIVGLNLLGQYRNHSFAERAGMLGGMNTKFLSGLGGFTEYSLELPRIPGYVSLGASLSTRWRRQYESASVFNSRHSDSASWEQMIGWSVYIDYTPIQYFGLVVGFEHGTSVRKHGVGMHGSWGTLVERLVDRNDTQLSVALNARY